MDHIHKILELHYPKLDWNIRTTKKGRAKDSYTAISGDKHLFIKLDANIPALARLGEISVAPKLLHQGSYKNSSYIIQEFITGTHPDRAWINAHLPLAAQLISTYHSDSKLKQILAQFHKAEATKHLQIELSRLNKSISKSKSTPFTSKNFQQAFKAFWEKSDHFKISQLVPTHIDPNADNIIVMGEKMVMVDWDEMTLSDEFRDIGPFLWWYVQPEKWAEFLDHLNLSVDTQKIYWWTAHRSLSVALWFDKRNDEKMTNHFLQDFYLAMSQRENTRLSPNSAPDT